MAWDDPALPEAAGASEAAAADGDRWDAYPVIVLVIMVTVVLATFGTLPHLGTMFPAGPPHLH